MPLNLNFGTVSERRNTNERAPTQRRSQKRHSARSEDSAEMARDLTEGFPTRKINTPVPVEWLPKTKKPKVTAATLMNIMLREGR